MVTSQSYESYKKHGNIMFDYDAILSFCPDYNKIKIELENIKFISKEEADKYFEENYKNSDLYNSLVKLNLLEEKEIYHFMKQNKNSKYEKINSIFEKLVISSIELCELIDYIGHYPTKYPVPKEEEKNPKMEALLEKFDIMVRYYLNEPKMQIICDDIVRIIEKLKLYLEYLNKIIWKTYRNEWLLTNECPKRINDFTNQILAEIESFPLSLNQENGKSNREEGKRYLKIQHNNIK